MSTRHSRAMQLTNNLPFSFFALKSSSSRVPTATMANDRSASALKMASRMAAKFVFSGTRYSCGICDRACDSALDI